MAFTDGDLITKQIDCIAADVVDFRDIDYIRPVHFEEGRPDKLFFHIFQGTIGDIAFAGGDEFDIVPHAFEEEDIVFFEFDQFVLRLDEEEVGVGGLGGYGRWSLCRSIGR